MTRRAGAAVFLAMALLFLLANRGAYRGYFQDDELDTISWAPEVSKAQFVEGLLTPRFMSHNFRPVPHFYFYLMSRWFGLDFAKYVFPLHALHLLNVWLIWLIARRLGASPFAAGAGALFFAFDMVVFDVLWKPMYVYDLLCTTFCLASLWLYLRRWLPASFAAFWLAYKSKELAVMLPAVLACAEYWFGKRRWKPLIPFFAVALWFGLQGLWFNPNRNQYYTFFFGPASVVKTIFYYANDILLFPFTGFLLLLLPLVVRDRRVWFGIAAMLLFFVPLAFLKYRTFDAYCYLPLAGVAIACAGVAGTRYRPMVIVFFLLWIPWNEFELRLHRRRALAVADENRAYVEALGAAAHTYPDVRTFIYDGAPFSMHPWGIRGALRIFQRTADIRLINIEDKGAGRAESGRVVLLSWDAMARHLSVVAHDPGAQDASYIRMNHSTPLWQLGKGWFGMENKFRWTEPAAAARLFRPAGARRFELVVNISPEFLRAAGHAAVEVSLDGRAIGRARFDAKGWQTARWDLAPATAGEVEVGFRAEPAYHPPAPDTRVLGVPIVAFGFVTTENP
jgi:hypothetical protein